MTEELRAALDVLVDYANSDMTMERLVALLLEVYPPRPGESRASTLCRMQAETDEVFEGLIGSVWGPEDEAGP